jgi:sugar lactone lactonase YvrE
VWSVERNALFFLDIKGKSLLSYKPSGGKDIFSLSEETGSIAISNSDGQLIAAQRNRICCLSLEPFSETMIGLPVKHSSRIRFNDGKCDAKGRFWVASMDDLIDQPIGQLWSVESDYGMRPHIGNFIVGNGIGWSLDNRKMYFTDSENRKISVFEYDLPTGNLGRSDCFASIDPSSGFPDGLTVDSQDHVWSAHWNGGRVTRYRPDGSVERVLHLPVPRPTSIAFGGEDMRSLFITSARLGLTQKDLQRAPWSGGLLEVKFHDLSGKPPMIFGRES